VSASLRRFTAALSAVVIGGLGMVLSYDCGKWATAVGLFSVALMGVGVLRLNDWCEEE
jgi:uncharacterized membrane protein